MELRSDGIARPLGHTTTVPFLVKAAYDLTAEAINTKSFILAISPGKCPPPPYE
jgi:hypothetical protein